MNRTDSTPRLNRITATLLYVTQPKKNWNLSKSTRSSASSYRKIDPERYHRYVVFGIPGTSSVLAMFTANSEESRRLFRYVEAIRPGTQVEILKPNVDGELNRGGTTLINTKEPLLPSSAVANVYSLPPYDVEGTSLEYKFFNFITNNIRIDSAVVAENVCPGILCDGQTYHDACPCLETSSSKVWVLSIEFQCPQLNEDVHNEDMHSIMSNKLTSFFVKPETRTGTLDNPNFDTFALDEAVQRVATLINGHQGFLVTGWFKPAQDDEGTAVEYKKFHVSSLEPATTMSNDQLDARYSVAVTTSTPPTSSVPPTATPSNPPSSSVPPTTGSG